jgi:hypothetical protein
LSTNIRGSGTPSSARGDDHQRRLDRDADWRLPDGHRDRRREHRVSGPGSVRSFVSGADNDITWGAALDGTTPAITDTSVGNTIVQG